MGSEFLKINWHDFLQSVKTGVVTAVVLTVYQVVILPVYTSLAAGQLPSLAFNWSMIGTSLLIAVAASVGSVCKRYFTNSVGEILKTETK